ncbi:hypothetical protein KY290_022271 [Solanum tuberosum]|uniref:Uncharacterized protein n=1 Tax=Solanum tuberosum TaxID=4113 RepID=A0ABQ7V3X6_SOLTU|nr:hypothetical protein KY289_021399 [Solanum tuberosum]KAH0728945.1 hypothetical protein KY289_000133 [Solanum tuberosum]KAH0758778.1 hypothetical protein KY290_022271 [Solanum tuberosum]
MRVDGLTDGCCRTQLQVCSCCSIDEDDGSFPSILTCEGEEVAYRGRLGVARELLDSGAFLGLLTLGSFFC